MLLVKLCETFLRTNNPESQLSLCGYNDRTDTQVKMAVVIYAMRPFPWTIACCLSLRYDVNQAIDLWLNL